MRSCPYTWFPLTYGILVGGYAFTMGIARCIFAAKPRFCIGVVDLDRTVHVLRCALFSNVVESSQTAHVTPATLWCCRPRPSSIRHHRRCRCRALPFVCVSAAFLL